MATPEPGPSQPIDLSTDAEASASDLTSAASKTSKGGAKPSAIWSLFHKKPKQSFGLNKRNHYGVCKACGKDCGDKVANLKKHAASCKGQSVEQRTFALLELAKTGGLNEAMQGC